MTLARRRKNVLLFISDQHRADHLGCYGNAIVRTPHIDRIADGGTRFERFYVATPICMPNRATLMTGRMPSLHGVRHNGIPLSQSATTFVEVLAAAGYRTALIGKSHLQSISGKQIKMGLPEQQPDLAPPPPHLREARHPDAPARSYDQELPETWERNPAFEVALPFYGFQHVALAIGHGDDISGHYRQWLSRRHPDPASLIGRSNALPFSTACPQAWRTRVPEELYSTSFIEQETIAYLEQCAGSEAPFFLQCSFPDPHHPFTPPGKYWGMYDPQDIPLPAAFHHPPERRPPHLEALYRARDAGASDAAGHTVSAITADEARAAIALTYGSITMIDDAIGRVLQKLRDLGLDHETLIIFTTDHGDMMGDHQLLLKGALHYSGLVRVPCIWSDPAVRPSVAVSRALCGTIDLAPSILEYAGIAPVHGMQGRSLPDTALHPQPRDMVIEDNPRRSYMGFPSNFGLRTLITEEWRLSLYSGVDWGELYNLKQDPHEFHNLWDSPEAQEMRSQLIRTLALRMMDLADPSPLATGHGP